MFSSKSVSGVADLLDFDFHATKTSLVLIPLIWADPSLTVDAQYIAESDGRWAGR